MTDPRWATLPEATRIRWIRVLNDHTPGTLSVMSRWAVHIAANRGDATTIAPIVGYALHWHDWGFAPDDWWMLIAALNDTRAKAGEARLTGDELSELNPADWASWPAMLADNAPLAAHKALSDATARNERDTGDEG